MAWLAYALLSLTALALGRWLWRLPRPALTLLAAALALGGAGYALLGRPEIPGRPVAERPPVRLPPALVDPGERDAVFGTFTRATSWLRIGEGYLGRGDGANAVAILRSGIRADPREPVLHVALGDALARHGRGVNAAAMLAFERAVRVAPDHPGPRYYLGLARLASRDGPGALESWREALARTKPETAWRPQLERRIAALETVAAGAGR